jgi:hypothetical protein
MDLIGLAQRKDQGRAVVNTVMNLGKLLSSCTTSGLSRRARLHGVSYTVSAMF